MTTETKQKPDVITVYRYVRELDVVADWDDSPHRVYSNSGLTLKFDIDYKNRTYTARVSVCNGDNFCKAKGRELVNESKYAYTFALPVEGVPHCGIVGLFFDDVTEAFKENKLDKDQRKMFRFIKYFDQCEKP